jgi:hypothetical protein
MHNKKSKRDAVSSDTDEKEIAPVKKRRRIVEEESPVKMEEEIEDDLDQQDKADQEDSKRASAAVKEEMDETEDGEGDLQLDRDEPEDCKQPPTVIKEEEKDQTEENYDCDAYQRDEEQPEDSKQASAAVKEEEEDEGEVGHEYPSSANIVIKNNSPWSLFQPDTCRSAEGSRQSANTVKIKYSLRSLSQENNKKSSRSKPLRKDKGSSTCLGEVNRSPMATSDEYESGRGIESDVDEAISHTRDSVDGIIDHDEVIFDRHDAQFNRMYERLHAFNKKHGHCELFWAADLFNFILNTPTNTLHVFFLTCR